MLVADTSVWARAHLNDDAAQAKKARKALADARGGGGGFPDHLIAQVGLANGAREIITFDQKFSRAEGVRRLK